jgi:hypothetical protein
MASAYLDVSGDSEDAQRRVILRWEALREQLAHDGAPRGVLAALETHLGMPAPRPELFGSGRGGVALFATGEGTSGRLILQRRMPRLPGSEYARWAPLPDVLPLLHLGSLGVPRVAVLADRVGADVFVWGPDEEQAEHLSVEGQRDPITKVAMGGWSQRRFQQRAENVWQQNAGGVAEKVDRLVVDTRARLLVIAGDERACGELRNKLAPRSRELLVHVNGSRAPGSDPDRFLEAVERVATERTAAVEQQRIDAFLQEAGRARRAVPGLARTVAALREAAVDTLLLDASQPYDADLGELWFGPSATDLAVSPEDLPGGLTHHDRARPVLVRAAAGTDASVVMVEPETLDLPDGVGALLRFRDEAMGQG